MTRGEVKSTKAVEAADRSRRHHTLILRALGAAIPTCMSLSMAIRDALPCGTSGTVLEVRTGSVDVNDEVIPEDDSENEVCETLLDYDILSEDTLPSGRRHPVSSPHKKQY